MIVGAIIQARTASTRLPKKVLMELPYKSGITVCHQVIRRSKKSKLLNSLILATTTSREDLKLVKIAKDENINFFRGNEKKVIDRYFYSASENKLDVIVRLCCDNPCIDWNIIDKTIKTHLINHFDYTNSMHAGSYPIGTNVEVFNYKALRVAHEKATKNYEIEHVTPYFYDTAKERFKISTKIISGKNPTSEMRLTLDTFKDYLLLCAIFDNLYYKKKYFTLEDIKKLYTKKPWLGLINNDIQQKTYNE